MKKTMKTDAETKWDKLLKIKTSGRDASHAGEYNYPYEPTPYPVLERLASRGYVGKRNTLVDYGCGKGRVAFFMAYQTRCRCLGIEYDGEIIRRAEENLKTGAGANRIKFMLTKAESYELPEEADSFYFFNPFSVEILKRVLKKIIILNYVNPRPRQLFFYYPSPEYLDCLRDRPELEQTEDIDCSDIFDTVDRRERIAVYGLRP